MHKYGESKTTRIMMATVPHVTSGLGLRKFQADGFLLTHVYMQFYGIYFTHPYKQSGRWQDVLDTNTHIVKLLKVIISYWNM